MHVSTSYFKVLILQTVVFNFNKLNDILGTFRYISLLSADCNKAQKEHDWSLAVSKAREKEET
jgi:hypothetical protein